MIYDVLYRNYIFFSLLNISTHTHTRIQCASKPRIHLFFKSYGRVGVKNYHSINCVISNNDFSSLPLSVCYAGGGVDQPVALPVPYTTPPLLVTLAHSLCTRKFEVGRTISGLLDTHVLTYSQRLSADSTQQCYISRMPTRLYGVVGEMETIFPGQCHVYRTRFRSSVSITLYNASQMPHGCRYTSHVSTVRIKC